MKPPYERLEAESKQAFKGPFVYRIRAYKKPQRCWKEARKNYSLIERWPSHHNWVERARAFDEEMD
ncbi:hypothetical protein LI071_17470 [Bacillus subtilis]|uniref:hypothetical protein n=1 Tax=Bacillus subtilis TaxID=1423 RepID=UPI001D08C95E|nr:hypothetical protein [Bacillus subtilis]MCB7162449.1 hypothetical protein [Bacillus subtilis]MCB7461334.1 hypothetical protein [Bacillus subtilis]